MSAGERSGRFELVAMSGTFQQDLGVEEMLGLEPVRRPLAIASEFDAQEVADFLVDTVSNDTWKRTLAILNDYFGSLRVITFALETDAGKRDILQNHDFTLLAARLVAPTYIHQVCTKQTLYRPSVCHVDLIGTIPLQRIENMESRPFCSVACAYGGSVRLSRTHHEIPFLGGAPVH